MLPVSASLLLLGGCAEMQRGMEDVLQTTGTASVGFECEGDRELDVAFSSDGREARLMSGGESIDLRLVDTREQGDTRIYENRRGTVRMVDEGDEIHVRIEGKDNFTDCEPDDPDYRRSSNTF
ncbi:MAG TPA: hypothetical protein VFZ01_09415 [Geminicoccaceae bacterium]